MIQRGGVFWVALDPTLGAEIQKTRPALVVSNDVSNRHSPLVTVLPITSKSGDHTYPFEIPIGPGDGGLKEGGKIKANQIRTVDKRRLKGRALGALNASLMAAVDEAVKIHLSLS